MSIRWSISHSSSYCRCRLPVFAAFCRPAVLTLLVGKDEVKEGGVPNVNRLGLKRFLRYAGVIVLLHGTVFFVLESLTWSFFYLTLLRII